MDTISIRYGQTLTLPLDTGNTTADSADIYIGKPGEVYILTKHITLTDGLGTFVFTTSDTEIPLDIYNYQINVNEGTNVDKYPSPGTGCGDCEEDLPEFIVYEALDLQEVS